jgi:ubiquinone/menaquinone biosynthesis C-methylase UbiE
VKFGRRAGVPSFISREMYDSDSAYDDAMEIIDFWGNGWKNRLSEDQHAAMFELEGEPLAAYANKLVDRHRANQSSMVDLVGASDVASQTVLNIGCGSGSESLVIANSGARCIGVDITAEAASAAELLIRKLGARGFGIQADARFLPIRSDSVDTVYSSGVLHHSPDIQKSLAEVYRVLRPGGKVYVMLYATWSINFMQPRLFGFLKGNFSRLRQQRVMSESTEGDWRTGKRTNPHTQTFTKQEAKHLFAGFRCVSVSKRVFSFRQFFLLGRVLHALRLVEPLDKGLKFLNPILGACLFIEGEK